LIRIAVLLVVLAAAAHSKPLLSIDPSLAKGEDYAAAINLIVGLGADATSISLFWDEMEVTPGTYSPAEDWPSLLNAYYPTTGLSVSLTFSVIDTTADRRPPDLQGLAWDDPVLIDRFRSHMDAVLDHMSDIDLTAISIGNEVDALLQSPSDIAAYARFLAAARAHLGLRRPGVPVGTKLTFGGINTNPAIYQPLLAESDAALITYYPLGPDFTLRPVADVPGDLDRIVALAQGLPIYLLETGYPSDGCGAVPGAQAAFVSAMLEEVTARGDPFKLISFTFLTDLPPEVVDYYAGYYGVGGDCFARYLGTLGLRTNDGREKPAIAALRAQH
jgi:hypothetical protein